MVEKKWKLKNEENYVSHLILLHGINESELTK